MVVGMYFQELVVMGAPGSYYWTGTIKVYNLTSDTFYSPNKDDVDSHRYSYLGERLLTWMSVKYKSATNQRGLNLPVCVCRLCCDCGTLLLTECDWHSGRGAAAQQQREGTVTSSFCFICELVPIATLIMFFFSIPPRFTFSKLMACLWWRVFKPQGKWYGFKCGLNAHTDSPVLNHYAKFTVCQGPRHELWCRWDNVILQYLALYLSEVAHI